MKKWILLLNVFVVVFSSSVVISFAYDGTATVDIGADEYIPPVTVCVSNVDELQNALTTAATNGRDDIIQVVQGGYSGTFVYSSTEGHHLTMQAGYTSGCAGREVDPVNTVLDGGGINRVLQLINDQNGGSIILEGFSVQNGAAPHNGGGIRVMSSGGKLGEITLRSNIITGNTAAKSGGGVWVWSKGDDDARVDLTNNIIRGNTANDGEGGGIAAYASSEGSLGNITLINNIITGNAAMADWARGGGVLASEYVSIYEGITVTITNNTISGNSAEDAGGGIKIKTWSPNSSIDVYNNIVWGNLAPKGGDMNFSSSGTYNGFSNDYADLYLAWTAWSFSANNIDADPRFANSSIGDYHLQKDSPCIDAGTNAAPRLPASDFDGDPRVIDGNNDSVEMVDIGADEYVRIIKTMPGLPLLLLDGND